MKRLLLIGLALVEYTGENKIQYKAKAHRRKWITLEKGDVFACEEYVAINLCKKDFYERVEYDLDALTLFNPQPQQAFCEENKIIGFQDPVDPAKIEKELETLDVASLTKRNLQDFSTEALIEFGKSKNITGMNKRISRDKLIPKILPYIVDDSEKGADDE
jgi:hypothetical protein